MKREIVRLVVIAFVLFTFTGCMGVSHLTHKTDRDATNMVTGTSGNNQENQASPDVVQAVYTCSMHPEVVSNKPGNCPKCGMELVLQKPGTAMKGHKMGMMCMMPGAGHGSNGLMYVVGGALMLGMMVFMIF